MADAIPCRRKNSSVPGCLRAALAVFCFLLLFPQKAQAQFTLAEHYDYANSRPDMGDYLNPDITLETLVDAVDPNAGGHAGAMSRFNDITQMVAVFDPDTGQNVTISCGQNCSLLDRDPGGPHLINQIVNALQAELGLPQTAPTVWPDADEPRTAPEADLAPVITLLNQAIGGDLTAFQTVQRAFAANNFFASHGYNPIITQFCGPNCVTYHYTRTDPRQYNVGQEALAYLAGGGGLASSFALNTIAWAVEGEPNAREIMSVIMTRDNLCNLSPPSAPEQECLDGNDKSIDLYTMLNQTLPLVAGLDQALDGLPTADIIRAAIDGNATASAALGQLLGEYLNNVSTPPSNLQACRTQRPPPTPCFAYIGASGVAYLEGAAAGLPAITDSSPPSGPPPRPADDGTLSTQPVTGVNPYASNDPGRNTAPVPCNWQAEDVTLQTRNGVDRYGTDPCWLTDGNGNRILDPNGNEIPAFTRNTLNLDFAKQFQGGEQWQAYFPGWVQTQWMPALRKMTAQWTAAIIDQTRMIGSLMDGIAASKTAAMIQKHEADTKLAVAPGEQACTSASPTQGLAHAEIVSTALSTSLKKNLSSYAGGALP